MSVIFINFDGKGMESGDVYAFVTGRGATIGDILDSVNAGKVCATIVEVHGKKDQLEFNLPRGLDLSCLPEVADRAYGPCDRVEHWGGSETNPVTLKLQAKAVRYSAL